MSNHEFDKEVVNDLQTTLAEKIDEDLTIPVANEEGQLALFEEEVSAVEQSKKSKKTKNTTTKMDKKDLESKEVTSDWTVVYAGSSIPVPQATMTLGTLRGFLEKSYPELSEERTSMTVDETTKTITPVVSGAKKG